MSVWRKITAKAADGTVEREKYYTIKFNLRGKQRTFKTTCTTEREALALQTQLKRNRSAEDLQEILDQITTRHTCTIGQLLEAYTAVGCPDRRMTPRPRPEAELRHIETLKQWWAAKSASNCGLPDCHSYYAWRQANVTRGTGARTTELELVTLSNCLDWSVATGRIKLNPIRNRTKYVDPHAVRHCRTVKPESGDELHLIANWFFDQGPNRETCGWLFLFLALTGQRPSEPLSLRWDAARFGDRFEPGYNDAEYLYVHRFEKGAQTKIRAKPPIRLTDPDRSQIKPLVEALRAWRDLRCPEHPYYFPGRAAKWDGHGPQPDKHQPLSKGALEHALRDACRALGLPQREPNGLRAYYCTARRGQGIPDAQIAYELGHVDCNPEHVRKVYGDIPANWKGLANVFTWLPNSPSVPIAWERWLPRPAAGVGASQALAKEMITI